MEDFFDKLFSHYVVFFIFFLIGLIEIIVFIFITRSRRNKIRNWYETEGKIVDVIEGRGSKGGRIYYPVFEFKTHLGEKISKKSGIGSNPNPYPVNSDVTIFYKPDNTEKFIIKGDKRLKLAGCILGAVFGIFFLVGLAGMIWLAIHTGVQF